MSNSGTQYLIRAIAQQLVLRFSGRDASGPSALALGLQGGSKTGGLAASGPSALALGLQGGSKTGGLAASGRIKYCVPKLKLLVTGALVFFSASFALAESVNRLDLRPLEDITVQSGGRLKPLGSLAREIVIFVTGKETFRGRSSLELLVEWLAHPAEWESEPLIPIPFKALQQALGLAGAKRVSPKFLASNSEFMTRADELVARSEAGETLTAPEKKHLELYEKMSLFYSSAEGKTWTIIPDPAGNETSSFGAASDRKWLSLAEAAGSETSSFAPALQSQRMGAGSARPLAAGLSRLLESYRAENQEAFSKAAENFKAALGSHSSFAVETHYNRLRPFRWAWRFYLAAFLIFLLNALPQRRMLAWTALTAAACGFLFHTYGFVLRCVVAGRPPVSNMYESVVWVSWAVVLFSLILFLFFRSYHLCLASSAVASFGLLLADSFPAVLDPSIAPLVPVLRSNFWLSVHVLTITLSYGAFALALGIGHFSLIAHAFRPEDEPLAKNLTQYLYRSLQIGVVLLSAGTILGGVWANYSWGRFWGWDPKETWALIALLGYLAILHSRFVGWLSPFGLAVGSVVGFLGVLMAWYGVNFVLAAGLHSYGFGGGGFPYVSAFVLADLGLVGLLALRRRTSRKHISIPAR